MVLLFVAPDNGGYAEHRHLVDSAGGKLVNPRVVARIPGRQGDVGRRRLLLPREREWPSGITCKIHR